MQTASLCLLGWSWWQINSCSNFVISYKIYIFNAIQLWPITNYIHTCIFTSFYRDQDYLHRIHFSYLPCNQFNSHIQFGCSNFLMQTLTLNSVVFFIVVLFCLTYTIYIKHNNSIVVFLLYKMKYFSFAKSLSLHTSFLASFNFSRIYNQYTINVIFHFTYIRGGSFLQYHYFLFQPSFS